MTANTSATSGFRSGVTALVEASWFNAFITFVIILNAITLGCATYQGWSAQTLAFFRWFDAAVTFIFVVEIGLKLIAYRGAFFKNGWNVFDFAIVAIALAPVSQSFSVLRALRVLRVLRLISVVPMLRKVVEALFRAIPGMGAIAAVLALMIYVAAVMATTMYGASVPELFGSLERSAFTLFQVMTMDGWRNEAVQPVMDAGHPFAWVFFLLFILVGSFAVLNLFIGLIVEAMNDDIEKDVERLEAGHVAAHEEREDMLAVLSAMRAEIAELKAAIDAKD
ncbi:MAG: ion transporter [Pseudomonadota bacterium]